MQAPDRKPILSEQGKAEAERRDERLAAALRDNLRKRKTQQRRRSEADAPEGED
jgi:hypothetical protein